MGKETETLTKFGANLTSMAAKGALPRAYGVQQSCQNLLQVLQSGKPRSMVLLGESGCGKTALVNELAYQLLKTKEKPWQLLRMSSAEFLAGTKWLGEWQTKLKQLVSAIRRPRRVILYIPNLEELSSTGTTSSSETSVATALAPHIEDGSVLVLGESRPVDYEQGLGSVQSLRRLFEIIQVPEATEADTREILTAVVRDAGIPIHDGLLEHLAELAFNYRSNLARPGNAVGLLRQVLAARRSKTEPITAREVLNVLSTSTGIPVNMLDDQVTLDLPAVKSFFATRVMGQPEAVDAVTDVVTLIKAGLTDPNKPFAVLFFAGPTGVGKTELARSVAEFIFGDPSRLLRFDMSEFASYEDFERLIGAGRCSKGLLTSAIRQQPFSVVLLDEIEKGHTNIFDLCLQVFDAGRLTDGRGRTIDCRHTVIILTSNVGAASPFASPLGFGAEADPAVDENRTMRALSKVFRPEFLNRIDRIIHFQPLSLDVAENIARREVQRALQRSGIARRDLAVDVDPSVLAMLLKEGYSPHFGARPLKRAVEKLVLLPVARAIAAGKIPPKAVLRLSQSGKKLNVSITSLEPEPERPPVPTVPHTLVVLREKAQSLLTQSGDLATQLRPVAERKSALLESTRTPGFWNQPDKKAAILDEIHKLDHFLAAQHALHAALTNFTQRLIETPAKDHDLSGLHAHLNRLETELVQLRAIAGCRDAQDLADAVICIKLVNQHGRSQRGVERIAKMYLGLAQHRGLDAEVLAERYDEKTGEDCAYLRLSGLGAYALLRSETGLHEMIQRRTVHLVRSAKEQHREDRDIVRVDVFPAASTEPTIPAKDLKLKTLPLAPPRSRLVHKANTEITLFHEPSLISLMAWTRGSKTEASKQVLSILHAQLHRTPANTSSAEKPVVRRYELGSSLKVKDFHTGKTVPHVDRVLKGHLDVFLMASKKTM